MSVEQTTPLHWAVYQVDETLVKELLRREADPDTRNSFGSSPLSEAARLANVTLVEQLLDAGANPKVTNADGQTPLMLAAWNGSVEIARALVAKGANVNDTEQWTGQTALMWATSRNHGELAQFLIAQGAEVNARALYFDWSSQITSEPRGQYRPAGGLTPLLFAVQQASEGVLWLHLEHPALSAATDGGATTTTRCTFWRSSSQANTGVSTM